MVYSLRMWALCRKYPRVKVECSGSDPPSSVTTVWSPEADTNDSGPDTVDLS